MFCASCRSEYREGFDTCADCGAALVDELPPEPQRDTTGYEAVMATHNPGDIAMVESLLDAANIDYYFVGEQFAVTYSVVSPARLMVKKEQVEQAGVLLKDLSLSLGSVNPSDDSEDSDED